jgi:hypothetical protein
LPWGMREKGGFADRPVVPAVALPSGALGPLDRVQKAPPPALAPGIGHQPDTGPISLTVCGCATSQPRSPYGPLGPLGVLQGKAGPPRSALPRDPIDFGGRMVASRPQPLARAEAERWESTSRWRYNREVTRRRCCQRWRWERTCGRVSSSIRWALCSLGTAVIVVRRRHLLAARHFDHASRCGERF